jgi:hypothetical protein
MTVWDEVTQAFSKLLEDVDLMEISSYCTVLSMGLSIVLSAALSFRRSVLKMKS